MEKNKILESFICKQRTIGLILMLSTIAILVLIIIFDKVGRIKEANKEVLVMMGEITETIEVRTEVTTFTTNAVTRAVTTTESQTEESITETETETEITTEESSTEPRTRIKWTLQTVSPNLNNIFTDILSDSEYILPDSYEIDVNCVYQNPELPTGCEVTSLTTVLNHFGYTIGKMDMANNYLIKDNYGATDFSTAFIGNPQTERGYGCYSPVIVNTAQRFLDDHGNLHSVEDLSGYELRELFKVISNDYPIVVWCTMSLVEPKEVYVWTLAGNIDVYWMRNEHCVVLTGYDLAEGTVTVSDPQKGIIKYNLDRFEKRFTQLGKQAVAIK